MAADAQDVTERALRASRRNRACRTVAIGAVAASGHASAHASTSTFATAGAMFALTTAITFVADAAGAPPLLVWIWAALAGTMAGAFAAVMVSLILSPRAPWKRHAAILLLAFVFGLIVAPLAALAWNPRPPEHIPLAVIWFAISGICGFIAPAGAIALHKRSEGIAEDMIDKVSTPKQARDERRHAQNEDERNEQ